MKKETKAKKPTKKVEQVEVVETKETELVNETLPIEFELTEAELRAEELKKEHKEVFITKISGIEVIWRKLKRSEYKIAMTTEFNPNPDIQYFERQEYMAKQVILYPENVDALLEEYAGIADIIATETMIKTGFGITNTKTV